MMSATEIELKVLESVRKSITDRECTIDTSKIELDTDLNKLELECFCEEITLFFYDIFDDACTACDNPGDGAIDFPDFEPFDEYYSERKKITARRMAEVIAEFS